MNRTVLTVDVHDDVSFFAVVLLRSRHQRSLDPLEHDLFVDVLVSMDRIDDSQNLLGIHGQPFRRVFARGDGKIKLFELFVLSELLSSKCGRQSPDVEIVSPSRPAETERQPAHRSETHCAKRTYSVWRTLKSIPRQC